MSQKNSLEHVTGKFSVLGVSLDLLLCRFSMSVKTFVSFRMNHNLYFPTFGFLWLLLFYNISRHVCDTSAKRKGFGKRMMLNLILS